MTRTLAVDTHSLIFRSYFAAQGSPDAIEAAMKIMHRLLGNAVRRVDPHYVVAASDCPEPTFRHKLDASYKASRDPSPPELKQLLPRALARLEEIGIPLMRCPGYEADDILATLAVRMKEGHTLHVLSSDRDLVGLVKPGVNLLLMQSGGKQKLVSMDNAHELFGVAPDLVADYKALVGDASDNIPGVQGIGPKTTLSLLSRYGSLDKILESRDDLPGKAALLKKPEAVEVAVRCKQLADLYCSVPVEMDARSGLWTSDKLLALRSG